MSDKPIASAASGQVQAFLDQAASLPRAVPGAAAGRLLFAMDATASREPSWVQARAIQARMFQETTALGGLQVQLCYYRGLSECRSSRWINQPEELARLMQAVDCEAGLTQVRRVLKHALDEVRKAPIQAMVLIGDCFEEDPDAVAGLAGQLALHRVPVFVFQEGFDASAERMFRSIAKLSGGAFARFDGNSPQQLRELLTAVAVYAAGGRDALNRRLGNSDLLLCLTRQLD